MTHSLHTILPLFDHTLSKWLWKKPEWFLCIFGIYKFSWTNGKGISNCCSLQFWGDSVTKVSVWIAYIWKRFRARVSHTYFISLFKHTCTPYALWPHYPQLLIAPLNTLYTTCAKMYMCPTGTASEHCATKMKPWTFHAIIATAHSHILRKNFEWNCILLRIWNLNQATPIESENIKCVC